MCLEGNHKTSRDPLARLVWVSMATKPDAGIQAITVETRFPVLFP
jgi:hypothetical protein